MFDRYETNLDKIHKDDVSFNICAGGHFRPSISAENPQGNDLTIDVQTLRDAIPAHCFRRSYFWAIWYSFHDCAIVSTLMIAAYQLIPLIGSRMLRCIAWLAYGYIEGLAMTGIWVLSSFATLIRF